MDKKNLALLFGLSLAFSVITVVLAALYKPQVPGAEPTAPGAIARTELPQTDSAETSDSDETSANQEDQAVEAGNTEADNAEAGNTEQAEAVAVSPERPEHPRRFVAIGSLSETSPYRHLICLDSLGATVRRVELNARNSKGGFLFRDVEYLGAYIGELELENVVRGVKVRLVGPGTPAAEAGMQVGDVITAINDEPVANTEDFDRMLTKKENGPGNTLRFAVLREPQTTPTEVSVQAIRRPMQVVQPSPDDKLREYDRMHRGFQLTLQKQTMADWVDLDQQMRLGNWETKVADDGKSVEFIYDLPAVTIVNDKERVAGIHKDRGSVHGPFQIVKRYQLPDAPPEGEETEEDRSFHFVLEFEIRNLSKETQSVNYELVGPTGTPLEGWWYQQKVHGRTWAIGRIAGARDIITSTVALPYQFTSGPEIVSTEAAKQLSPVINPGAESEDERTVNFLSVDTQYFNVALFPQQEAFSCFSAFAITASDNEDDRYREQRVRDLTWVMFSKPVELSPYQAGDASTAYQVAFDIFAGPKEPELLSQYGLDDTRSFGWFAMFSKPLCWLLHVFYNITFQWSYGLAIILLTVLVRSLMIPISRQAALNAQMMQHLQPEIKRIAEKYKDDFEKRGQAQRELFARHRYNPFGGCLLMFLQLPVFIGLYRGLSTDIALRDQPFIPGVPWCTNLAGPDMFLNWQSWMPSWFSAETGWLGPYLNILPIATIVLFLIQQKMFMPPATDEQTKMTQRMMTVMMVVMGFLFFKVPSGLCIYFITSSIWGILERKLLPKPELVNPPKFGDESEDAGNNPSEPVALPLRNEAQLEERRRRDRERKKKLRDRK